MTKSRKQAAILTGLRSEIFGIFKRERERERETEGGGGGEEISTHQTLKQIIVLKTAVTYAASNGDVMKSIDIGQLLTMT